MQERVKFYYNPMSRGAIVHWLLEELGAPYDIQYMDWKKKDHKSAEYLKINPMGKIPAIQHHGVVVTESAAICMYLADAFPQFKLAPEIQDPRRGEYYRWFMFIVGCVDPALMDHKYPRIEKIEASHLGYGTFEDTMKTLEGAVSRGFLLQDQFTAADVYLASTLHWAFKFQGLTPRPVLQDYLTRCHNRPAHHRYLQQVESIIAMHKN